MTQTPTEAPPKPTKRKRRVLQSIGLTILALLVLMEIINAIMYFAFIPRQTPIFAELKKPFIVGHQGAEDLAPTNTMAAFDLADSLGVDFLDTDINMTKDGYLVTIHDNTVDRTTNGHGRVDSFTLAELQKLDAGYSFKDLQGNYSYRGKGIIIPTLEEVLSKYAATHYFNIEIKEAYPKNGPSQIEDKLWDLLKKYHLEKKTIVNSFHQELLDHFHQLSGGQVPLGAGTAEVAKFVFLHKAALFGFYHPDSQVLEIPYESSESYGISLIDRGLIEEAHRLGMQVYYWTVNDKPTMKMLLELGADGLITSRPDLMKEVLHEMNLK